MAPLKPALAVLAVLASGLLAVDPVQDLAGMSENRSIAELERRQFGVPRRLSQLVTRALS